MEKNLFVAAVALFLMVAISWPSRPACDASFSKFPVEELVSSSKVAPLESWPEC